MSSSAAAVTIPVSKAIPIDNYTGVQTSNLMGFSFGAFHNRMLLPAERPPKFGGFDFKIWQEKMLFYLTMLGLSNFLTEDEPAAPKEYETTSFVVRASYDNWRNDDYICKNFILNGLEDGLYNVYVVLKTSKEIWEALEKKYRNNDDARMKNFVVAKYLDYKMVDDRPIMDQVHEFQLILYEVTSEGMELSEGFIVGTLIEKLPPTWTDLQKRKQMTLEDLIVKLRIESDMRKHYLKLKGPIDTKANLLKKGSNKRARSNAKHKGKGKMVARKFEGNCYNCDKSGHMAKDCQKPKMKKAKQDTFSSLVYS